MAKQKLNIEELLGVVFATLVILFIFAGIPLLVFYISSNMNIVLIVSLPIWILYTYCLIKHIMARKKSKWTKDYRKKYMREYMRKYPNSGIRITKSAKAESKYGGMKLSYKLFWLGMSSMELLLVMNFLFGWNMPVWINLGVALVIIMIFISAFNENFVE